MNYQYARYTVYPVKIKETGEVYYMIRDHQHIKEDSKICYGFKMLYLDRDFVKIYNAFDAITFVNYLNQTNTDF